MIAFRARHYLPAISADFLLRFFRFSLRHVGGYYAADTPMFRAMPPFLLFHFFLRCFISLLFSHYAISPLDATLLSPFIVAASC